MPTPPVSPWNSLEVVKLMVSGLTPIAVLLIGFWVNKLIKRVEVLQWGNQKSVEWKIRVYENFSPFLNDIYCYFLYVGNWRSVSPFEILEKKRQADRIFNLYRHLFSQQVENSYKQFIDSCFEAWRGKLADAGLRTGFQSREQAYGAHWDSKWNGLFVEVESPQQTRASIHDSYSALTSLLAGELGLPLTSRSTAQPASPVPDLS